MLFNTPKTLKTPPQYPDLSSIEHLWVIIEKEVRKHHIASKITLKNSIREVWSEIPDQTTKNLVRSIPNRLREVIKQKGYAARY